MKKAEKLERNVYITTNVSCNLDCIYCYEDKTSKETFDVEKTKKRLAKLLSEKTEKHTVINLHGGEPFLVFSKIKELCEWLWEENFPEKFLVFATSNGTLIHGEIKEWLMKNRHKFIVGLSLDGTREMQNTNRSNSFDLIDIDFFVETWSKQGVKMTISPQTIEKLAEGIIFLHSKNIQDIRANLAYMVDWSNPKYVEIFQRELQKLAVFYKANPHLPKSSIFNVNFASLTDKENKNKKWCGAGTEMVAHDIDGRGYPCHLFFESVCGKEKSEKINNVNFADPKEFISDECADCLMLAVCPTCYGSNYIERGNIGSRDMSLCKMNKIRIYEIAKYEYDKIVNNKTDVGNLSDEEKYKRIRTLDGIEILLPYLNTFN
ncbi:radical SAM protein [Bacteroides sp. 519]|uniref:radical SAM protein n=1 Tax=Bacteroides sp. 519 TaxID=2302937 RepID=UPI0013D2C530|nr:radical SAM protein [Bacteroides sp. 519]NDV59105.1 4Fe-4S cluster-binding domain-containing protein [Bacteroides sp. 519]